MIHLRDNATTGQEFWDETEARFGIGMKETLYQNSDNTFTYSIFHVEFIFAVYFAIRAQFVEEKLKLTFFEGGSWSSLSTMGLPPRTAYCQGSVFSAIYSIPQNLMSSHSICGL